MSRFLFVPLWISGLYGLLLFSSNFIVPVRPHEPYMLYQGDIKSSFKTNHLDSNVKGYNLNLPCDFKNEFSDDEMLINGTYEFLTPDDSVVLFVDYIECGNNCSGSFAKYSRDYNFKIYSNKLATLNYKINYKCYSLRTEDVNTHLAQMSIHDFKLIFVTVALAITLTIFLRHICFAFDLASLYIFLKKNFLTVDNTDKTDKPEYHYEQSDVSDSESDSDSDSDFCPNLSDSSYTESFSESETELISESDADSTSGSDTGSY